MLRRWFCFLIASAAFAQDGSDVYQKHCASCHDQALPREALKKLSPEGVLAALTTGTMKAQGAALTAAEARAVATFVSGKPFGKEETTQQGLCADTNAAFDPLAGPRWNGWGADLTNHRSQPAAMA